MADSPILTFEVYRDSNFLFREDLSAESITIGKGPAAMLRIEDDALADLQAVINLNDDGTVQILDLVGDGEMRGDLEAAIAAAGLERHVTLTGWLDEAGVQARLAAAHALVMPSFAEGLPMVVMEAMAAARPVIATYIAGTPELVRPGETGWLVPAGDACALADAVRGVSTAPRDTLAAMGAAGRKRVLQRHDVRAEAGKLAAHFRRAIG